MLLQFLFLQGWEWYMADCSIPGITKCDVALRICKRRRIVVSRIFRPNDQNFFEIALNMAADSLHAAFKSFFNQLLSDSFAI